MKTPQQLMLDNLIVKHYAGSHAYGTAIDSSDVDFRGIFCADPINIRTPFYPIKEVNDSSEEDTKFYELAQFMKLALDCNPNIIETLWVDPSDIVHSTPAYELLRSHNKDLLSSKIAFTTSGYAFSQLKRIKGHTKWINCPRPVAQPQPVDFISLVQNFSSEKIFKINIRELDKGHILIPYGSDIFGIFKGKTDSTLLQQNDTGTLNPYPDQNWLNKSTPLYLIKFNKDEYASAVIEWTNYWTWKKNRNEKRSELEEKFSYDTKHAMHLIRLLRMGAEALQTGTINVKRPDAEELLSIRAGNMTYDELVEYATELDNDIKNVWYPTTQLPKHPNIKLGAELILSIQDIIWTSI